MELAQFILYVADQEASKTFYEFVLLKEPVLHVPGMTEFQLAPQCKLGLMPEKGIAKILETTTPEPAQGNGIPRCEVYLVVKNAQEYYQRALEAGALAVSPVSPRDWGANVGYVMDMDGHILAFAEVA